MRLSNDVIVKNKNLKVHVIEKKEYIYIYNYEQRTVPKNIYHIKIKIKKKKNF